MIERGIKDEVLKRIGPIALQSYAISHGWQRHPLPERFKIALYRRPENPSIELVLPQTEEYADYLDRVSDFIRGLAEFEGVPVRQILNTVLSPHSDILRFGYEAPDAKLGVVPFLTGISLFDAALRSISTATYDVVRPERFHSRMSNPMADAYIESCRMGQTEYGSFVISCICPVEPATQILMSNGDETLVPETPALGRQVTKRIMNALTQIHDFVLADQVERLANPEPNDIVISGNFFESLMAFPVEHEAASLYVTASWDKATIPPEAPARADVRYDMFEAIDNIARQLRPARISREDKFIAKVITLSGEPNLEDQMEGDVVLLLLHQDAGVKAKIRLNAGDYAQAGLAHMQNKYVAVSGIFSKFRKNNRIEAYTSFSIVPD